MQSFSHSVIYYFFLWIVYWIQLTFSMKLFLDLNLIQWLYSMWNSKIHLRMWCFEAWSDIYSSASWLHRFFGVFGVTIVPTEHHSHFSLAWNCRLYTRELRCVKRRQAGLCSPSRDFHQQPVTVRINRLMYLDPVSRRGGYGARMRVLWCLRWDEFAESSLCCHLSPCRKSQPRVATMLTGFSTLTHRTCWRESCEYTTICPSCVLCYSSPC